MAVFTRSSQDPGSYLGRFRIISTRIPNFALNHVVFPKKKGRIDYSFDVINCLQQIEIPYLLNMCAPWSELPSNYKCHGITPWALDPYDFDGDPDQGQIVIRI